MCWFRFFEFDDDVDSAKRSSISVVPIESIISRDDLMKQTKDEEEALGVEEVETQQMNKRLFQELVNNGGKITPYNLHARISRLDLKSCKARAARERAGAIRADEEFLSEQLRRIDEMKNR